MRALFITSLQELEPSGDVVYYFTIRKPGSQEKWKTGIMED